MKRLIIRAYFATILAITEPLKYWAEFELLVKPHYHFFRLTAADEFMLRREHWTRLAEGKESDWYRLIHDWHLDRELRAQSALKNDNEDENEANCHQSSQSPLDES